GAGLRARDGTQLVINASRVPRKLHFMPLGAVFSRPLGDLTVWQGSQRAAEDRPYVVGGRCTSS
ncbi:MAG TPA: hypothetical protein VKR06_44750, partial [Ktedonosporobacter sp.]|nr:hypothetical protein [Ktedonosporobacter sp.]